MKKNGNAFFWHLGWMSHFCWGTTPLGSVQWGKRMVLLAPRMDVTLDPAPTQPSSVHWGRDTGTAGHRTRVSFNSASCSQMDIPETCWWPLGFPTQASSSLKIGSEQVYNPPPLATSWARRNVRYESGAKLRPDWGRLPRPSGTDASKPRKGFSTFWKDWKLKWNEQHMSVALPLVVQYNPWVLPLAENGASRGIIILLSFLMASRADASVPLPVGNSCARVWWLCTNGLSNAL